MAARKASAKGVPKAPSGPAVPRAVQPTGGRGGAQAPQPTTAAPPAAAPAEPMPVASRPAETAVSEAADVLSNFEQQRQAEEESQAQNNGLANRQLSGAGAEAVGRRWNWKESEAEGGLVPPNGRGRSLWGSGLLPTKFEKACTKDLSMASMWIIAGIPVNTPQMGPDQPEDPRFRVFLTQTNPSLLMLELNSLSTFNMMDADLSGDVLYGMDCISKLMQNPKTSKNAPLAYTVQGTGPHFCPGGNPNPKATEGHTVFTSTQYTGYMCFVRCREMAIPGVAALTGSLVGGGVAYSLNVTMRMATNAATFCYGNASRGAVPGMVLSSNIPQCIGLAGAMDLYLTDSTLSAYAALKAKYLVGIETSNQAVKLKAAQVARRLAASPHSVQIAGIRPPLDMWRYASEAHAINMSAKTGVLFSSVSTKTPVAQEAEDDGRGGQQPSHAERDMQAMAKASTKARPKRRPSAGRPKRRVRRAAPPS